MAQVEFTGDTTPNQADLDANFTANFSWRELISTPAHGSFPAYTASNAKGSVDSSYNFTWSGGGFTVSGGNLTASGTRSILVVGSGGLGYGTGSGGTVTQATSKSTAVSLNKTNGQIVMHNQSIAAGVVIGFVLSNSVIVATDVVVVSIGGGVASSSSYKAWVGSTASGQCSLLIENISGGALAEAVQLNFAVIKAVTS